MKIIRRPFYTFRVKWGKKYISPGDGYGEDFFDKSSIPVIIKEIEAERPQYRGKIVVFQYAIIKI